MDVAQVLLLFAVPHISGEARGDLGWAWSPSCRTQSTRAPPKVEINFKTTTEGQPCPVKCWLLLGAKWRFLPLIIKMAGKTPHGVISYIKQILWRRRLLVALFADLAFRQLAVIKSADLKYQLHLFKGAINKTLKPIKGAGFLGRFVKPADRLTSRAFGRSWLVLGTGSAAGLRMDSFTGSQIYLSQTTFLLKENLSLHRQQITLVL